MKKPFFACLLAVSAAAPALADQGCIEVSTTSVTTTVCSQFDCVQQADDSCIMWSCNKTQTSRYTDTNSSGCTRIANCGSRAVFSAGEPSQPDTDSTEVCDWYPCVQADPATKACLSYLCVSKRVFETVHSIYPDARCITAAPRLPSPPARKKPQPRQETEIRPSPVNNTRSTAPPPLR